jgi:hypothetical protein
LKSIQCSKIFYIKPIFTNQFLSSCALGGGGGIRTRGGPQ